jgi:hypothetical protein
LSITEDEFHSLKGGKKISKILLYDVHKQASPPRPKKKKRLKKFANKMKGKNMAGKCKLRP